MMNCRAGFVDLARSAAAEDLLIWQSLRHWTTPERVENRDSLV
jgi:hypothetical protein